MKKIKDKFVGVQISPISFIDEGVDNVLETLQNRVGVNVLLIGTVSWLGLKSGRSVSWKIDGWPDHGIPEPFAMKGGAYFDPNPNFYNNTFIKNLLGRFSFSRDIRSVLFFFDNSGVLSIPENPTSRLLIAF